MEGRPGLRVHLAIGGLALLLFLSPAAGGPTAPSVDSASGSLEPPYLALVVDYDSPADGEYDFLFVLATVNVTNGSDEFLLYVDHAGTGLGNIWLTLGPGRHAVAVPVSGRTIRQYNVNGPTTLTLTLEGSCSSGCVVLDTDTLPTGSFLATDFEGPDILISGTPSDVPVDWDSPSDGRFDALAIDVPVTVYEAGTYRLWANFGTGEVSNVSLLQPGSAVIRLLMPGYQLRGFADGHSVDLGLYVSNRDLTTAQGPVSFQTEALSWSTFETWGSLLSGSHVDAVDTDATPNGLVDALVAHVPVSVTQAGDYHLLAYLQTQGGVALGDAATTAHLDAGPGEFVVTLATYPIVAGRINDTLRVVFSISPLVDASNPSGPPALASGIVVAGLFNWTDFDPLPIDLATPVTDSYEDLDSPPDGLYDAYVARVPVIVREAGVFRTSGSIIQSGFQAIAENTSYLVPGTTTVNLTWSLGAFQARGLVPGGTAYVTAYLPAHVPLRWTEYAVTPPPGTGNGSSLGSPTVSFTGDLMASLPDADSDGLFDALDVSLPMNVTRPGRYAFLASLLSVENNLRVTFAANRTALDEGSGSLRLSFPAWAIRASGLGGPYTIYVSYAPDSPERLPMDFAPAPEHLVAQTPLLLSRLFDSDRPTIHAAPAVSAPTVDGVLAAGEWDSGAVVDLSTADPGAISATAYVMNDGDSVYVALDVLGDRTADARDSAGLSFDSGTLDLADPDYTREVSVGCNPDLFQAYPCASAALAYGGPPGRTNVSAARGFTGTSLDSSPHRVYEFRAPLEYLDASPGGTIGFAVQAGYTFGILDSSGTFSGWPATVSPYDTLPPTSYARLVLASAAPVNTRPTVAAGAPPNGSFASGTLAVSGTAQDPDGTVESVEVRVDDGPWLPATGATSWSLAIDTTALADGSHTISVRSFDGTDYSAVEAVNLVFDNTPPEFQVGAPTDGVVLVSGRVEVSWSGTDATSGIRRYVLQLDDSPALDVGLATSHVFEGVADGSHTVRITAVDGAGNEETQGIGVRVDTNPLSVSGPFGPWLVVGIAGSATAVGVAGVLWYLRRRKTASR